MTEFKTTQRRKPTRILAAVLALAMSATAIPATAFAASGDMDSNGGQSVRSRYIQQNTRQVRDGREHRGERGERNARRDDRRDDHRGDRRGGYRGDRRGDRHHADRRGRDDRRYGAYRGRRHHGGHDDDAGAAIAGALFGLAIGAIVADNYNQSRNAPPSQTYYGPMDTGPAYAPEPFTDDWYAYCASKYRSFDPQTGTFQPYEGPRKLCR